MRLPIPLLLIILSACTQGGGSDTMPPEANDGPASRDTLSLVGPLWVLDSLPGTSNIAGNGGRMPDLRFAEDGNAGGFSGCNSMGGPYTVAGDSLGFGPMVMTMMACQDGMEVERAYAEALEKVVRFERRDATLELFDGAGLVARFQAR